MTRARAELDPNDPDELQDEAGHFLALAASTPYEDLKACYLRLADALRGLAMQLHARGSSSSN